MAKRKSTTHSWKNIRSVLTEASQKDLLSLVGDLYALRKENQIFLHARFIKDGDALAPYKEAIEQYEPPRDCRRLFGLSHATIANSSICA